MSSYFLWYLSSKYFNPIRYPTETWEQKKKYLVLVEWQVWSRGIFKKNRSAMRTCMAYEIELLFIVWCLIRFLLEELISDYH